MSLSDWLDERTGHRALLDRWKGAPTKGGGSFAQVWGGVTALCLLVIVVTGILMMTAYQPSATTAWSSVHYIQTKLSLGWFIRGLHHNGAHFLVVLMVLHLVRTTVFAAYRKPRELTWLLGLALLGLTLAFVRTGYLLPWDQEGYWATYIPLNILGTMPGGSALKELAIGGGELGHMAITRFHALHVAILPMGLVLLLWAHAALARKHGLTAHPAADTTKSEPYFPAQAGRVAIVGMIVLAALVVFTVSTHGVPLQAPADPAADYPARPEWYFRAPFQALKFVPQSLEWLVLVGLPAVMGGYFVALPVWDKDGDASPKKRIGKLAPLALAFLVVAALTGLSFAKDAGDPDFAKARELADKRAARASELAMDGVPAAGPLAMLALDPQTRGPELYAKHCGVCHRLNDIGPEPGKDTAPDLTGFGTDKWVRAVLEDPDAPTLFGNTAFKELMPSFTKPPADPEEAEYFKAMSAEDMAAMSAWLVAEANGTVTPGMPGEKIAKTRCTTCHMLDGESDEEGSLAPELRGWGSVEWIRLQIDNPGNGKTYPPGAMDAELEGHMPAFFDKLSQDEISLLARWVYEQATGLPAPSEEALARARAASAAKKPAPAAKDEDAKDEDAKDEDAKDEDAKDEDAKDEDAKD